MSLLNNADQIYLGTRLVDEIYKGNINVYPNAYIYHPKTQERIDRAISEGFTLPSKANLVEQDNLMIALENEGTFWNTRDSFQLMRLGSPELQNYSRIDWKKPNGVLATDHGGTVFTSDGHKGTVFTSDGHKGNGVNAYRDTKLSPSNGIYAKYLDFGFTLLLMGDFVADSTLKLGVSSSISDELFIGSTPRHNNNYRYYKAIFGDAAWGDWVSGGSGNRSSVSSTSRTGESSCTLLEGYRETIKSFTSNSSVTMPNKSFFIGALNGLSGADKFTHGTCGLFSFGSKVNKAQHDFLITQLNMFFNKIGLSTI